MRHVREIRDIDHVGEIIHTDQVVEKFTWVIIHKDHAGEIRHTGPG